MSKELSGGLKTFAVSFVQGSAACDAHKIRNAIKGLGTDEQAIASVLNGRNNQDMEMIKAAYKEETKNELEKDIKGDLSGDIKHWYVAILQAAR